MYVLFLWDLATAFDIVNHEIFLSKSNQYGIRGLANEVIQDYLINCKHYVHVNGVSSSLENINNGVTQGRVLGPILLLICIIDVNSYSLFTASYSSFTFATS